MQEQIKDKSKLQLSYLLPNLITTGGLFAGFYAVVAAMNGHFEQAAVSIFIAMLLDGLDGRVARLTGTSSEFGAQYDSLADMVSFGIAPALVSFSWILHSLGKSGWALSFIYAAATGLRLARFNCQLGKSEDKKYFTGLPSPAAAGCVAGLIWVAANLNIEHSALFAISVGALVAAIGVLMVSNVKYRSFKDLKLKKKIPFLLALAIAATYALIAVNPAICLFAIFAIYTLSGPIESSYRYIRPL